MCHFAALLLSQACLHSSPKSTSGRASNVAPSKRGLESRIFLPGRGWLSRFWAGACSGMLPLLRAKRHGKEVSSLDDDQLDMTP